MFLMKFLCMIHLAILQFQLHGEKLRQEKSIIVTGKQIGRAHV